MKELNVRKFSRSIFPLLLPTMMIAALLQVPTTAFAIPSRCTVITSVSLAGGEGGHVIANNTLTASLNATTPASCTPNTPTYKWTYSSTSNMASPTTLDNSSATFTPTDTNPNLVGKYVRLTFSYKPYGATTTTLESSPTLVWPADVVIPAMDPDFPVTYTYSGSVLTAAGHGVVGNPTPAETYRWWSCTDNRDELFNALRVTLSTVTVGADACSVVSGATSDSYTVTGSETGSYFYPEVTETNEYGTVSAYGISLPEVTAPTFTGTSWEGQTLTRDSASATGYPSPTITYAWQTTSDGTTWTTVGSGETYKVKAADRSYAAQMQIRLTATAASGSQSDSKSSDARNTYTYPNATGGSVTADTSGTYTSGKYKVGQTVYGHPWSVMGTPWPTLTYQWWICDTSVATATPVASGCTASTPGTSTRSTGYDFSYVVPSIAAGKFLTFTATLTNAATTAQGSAFTFTQSRTMNSGVINTIPTIDTTPEITGTFSVGKKLTAQTVSVNSINTYPTGKITYQWVSSSDVAGPYAPITNARSTTYTPVGTDLNKYLKVIATATNNAGDTATATSTSAVLVTPGTQATLTISNTSLTISKTLNFTVIATGGSGDGARNYSVTGTGCTIGLTSGVLSASQATTCVVTAKKLASTGYNEVSSAVKRFTFTN